jgi:hypothetical protein
MKRIFQAVFALAVGAFALVAFHQLSAKGAPSTAVPATAEFRDAVATATTPSDKIRSDGQGTYQNGIDCVISEVFSTGEYFLRSVTNNCSTTSPRTVVLDFSTPVTPPASCSVTVADGTLNVCTSNSVPDTRLLADYMFSSKALTNGATVSLPFSLQPNFSGTDFELDFEQPLPVTGSSGLRTLTAGPSSIAELYELGKASGGRSPTKTSLGRFYMPFEVTVGE